MGSLIEIINFFIDKLSDSLNVCQSCYTHFKRKYLLKGMFRTFWHEEGLGIVAVFYSASNQWNYAGINLRTDRDWVHNGLWNHWHGQFCSR